MSLSCSECDHLDKSRKKWNESNYCYTYGCKARPDGYINFWCLRDSDLNTGGCSDFKHETVEQMSMF